MTMRPLITFMSDFGLDDWFVGVVHGVLHGLCPEMRIVDLTHAIAPGDVARAAFVLEAAAPDFPTGTVHLAVVDPGVGTERRALAVSAHRQYFVGPDNGLLEWALTDPSAEAYALHDPRFFRQPVSRTFHGRDVFAPVAAHLANGEDASRMGPRVTDALRLKLPEARFTDGALAGEVMRIDRFGNALTNLNETSIAAAFPKATEKDLSVQVGRRRLDGIARSYGDAPIGTVVAVMGSSGRLEIAQVGGAVSAYMGIGVGDPVRVRRIG
jgi:S-adenosyl-L-methionine hydrolase (adenosine-forming)